MMEIYFVRHGESEANILGEFSNRGTKHGLTERGRSQVERLCQEIANVDFEALFCSPLLRAVQTAEIISDRLGLPYTVAPALTEYDTGVLEGTAAAEGWQRYDVVLRDWLLYHRWESRIEGGESFTDIKNRFLPFIEDVIGRYGKKNGAVLLIGHGGTYKCMLPLVLSNVDFAFGYEHGIATADPIIGRLVEDALVCLKWGDRLMTTGD